MRLFRAQTCAPAAHDCALGGAPERRGAFGPRPAARDPKRCIRAVRATKIERTRTADMRSLARAANQRGEGARLVGGQAPGCAESFIYMEGDDAKFTVTASPTQEHLQSLSDPEPENDV